jgi:hypothetical protein
MSDGKSMTPATAERGKPWFDEQGRQRCGARTRTHGGPCRAHPVKGGNRCENHGGASPRGVSSPQFKHGRYSDHVPRNLAALYDEARSDPDLLALHEEIALLQARLRQVLPRTSAGEAGQVWRSLRTTWGAFKRAQSKGQVEEMTEQLDEIGRLIGKGATEAQAWDEIGGIVERIRRLTESEGKRRVQMQQMVTVDKLDVLLAQIVDAIKTEVHDVDTLRRLSQRLAVIVGVEG